MAETLNLFATLIHRAELGDPRLLTDLETACWALEDGDQAGHDWCNREGYPGYTSYASLDDLPSRDPAFASLVKRLDQEAALFSNALGWDLGAGRLVCDSLWVNILGEGGHHSGHIHPNSVLSGTCYIEMPEGAGRLKLEDPRLPMLMAAPPLKPNAHHLRFHYLAPVAGEVILWESWLRHEVMASQSEDPRVSISFNFAFVDR
ncbi:MAG: TIGR02466 family protein [Pseudomonadota bacterium]